MASMHAFQQVEAIYRPVCMVPMYLVKRMTLRRRDSLMLFAL